MPQDDDNSSRHEAGRHSPVSSSETLARGPEPGYPVSSDSQTPSSQDLAASTQQQNTNDGEDHTAPTSIAETASLAAQPQQSIPTVQQPRETDKPEQEAAFLLNESQIRHDTATATPGHTASRPSTWKAVSNAVTRGWVPEGLGCLLSIVSLGAIIATLLVFEDEPVPKWRFGITINAMVAIFSAFLKAGAALVLSGGLSQLKWQWFSMPKTLVDFEEFDSASRGGLGSLLFLFRTSPQNGQGTESLWPRTFFRSLFRWQRSDLLQVLAKISALIMVLLWAMSPFTQQVVRSYYCQRSNTAVSSSLSRTNVFGAMGNRSTIGIWNPDQEMATAMSLGLVNPPADMGTLIEFDCATGNCTFPPFSTLAVCHACRDVSTDIGNKPPRNASFGGFISPNMTLPGIGDQADLNLGSEQRLAATAGKGADGSILVNILATPLRNRDEVDGTMAISCNLMPCVRTLNATVEYSKLKETEIGRMPLGLNQIPLDLLELATQEEMMGHVLAWTKDDSIIAPDKAHCAGFDQPVPGLSPVPIQNIDATPLTSGYHKEASEKFQQMGTFISFGEHYMYSGDVAARRLHNDGNISLQHVDLFMGQLSNVMTAAIRKKGNEDSAIPGNFSTDVDLRGEVIMPMTCILVDWAWLSYAVAMVVLTVVWFVLLVLQSPHGEVTKRGWKSSSLALLFACVAEDKIQENRARGGKDLHDMSRTELEDLAKSINVQLGRDSEGKAKLD